MKKIITRYLMIGILIMCMSNFSFALEKPADMDAYCKSSSICGTAPEQFTNLMDFVRDMTNSIQTIGTAGDYLGKPVNPDRFQGNTFNPPAKSLLGKLATSVSQKIGFGLAVIAIFTNLSVGGLKDFGGGIMLLFQNKVFFRDTLLVEGLDSQVTDKRYELGMGGGWYTAINKENLAVMRKILADYEKKGLFLDSSSLGDGLTYSDIITMSVRLLSSAKTFLYVGSTSQFDSVTDNIGIEGITIKFNPDAIDAISYEYDCARSPNNVCSSERKKLMDGLSKLGSNTKGSLFNGVTTANTTFQDALTRLGETFSSSKNQSEEKDLLTSMYGTTNVTKPGRLFAPFQKMWDSVTSSVTGGLADVSRFRTFPKTPKGVAQDINTTQPPAPVIDSTTSTYLLNSAAFTQIIDGYLTDVFANQQADMDLTTYAEVKDVTPAFNVIGQQIYTITDSIIGNKQKDGSLIKSLGQACELQCGKPSVLGRCR